MTLRAEKISGPKFDEKRKEATRFPNHVTAICKPEEDRRRAIRGIPSIENLHIVLYGAPQGMGGTVVGGEPYIKARLEPGQETFVSQSGFTYRVTAS